MRMKGHQIVLLLSLIGVCYFGQNTPADTLRLLGWFALLVTICGNTKWVLPHKVRWQRFLRRLLITLPFALPWFLLPQAANDPHTWALSLGCGLVVGALLLGINIWRSKEVFFEPELLVAVVKDRKALDIAITSYSLIVAAICEELFFRGFIQSIWSGWHGVLLSGVSFVVFHVATEVRENFDTGDWVGITVASFAAALIYQWTNNILGAMAIHILINSLEILFSVKKWHLVYGSHARSKGKVVL